MTAANEVALLLDTDNTTLLDNDRFTEDIDPHIPQALDALGREYLFALKRGVALNEGDPSAVSRAGSVRRGTL